MRQAVLLAALVVSAAGPAGAQDRGLTPPADALTGSRWQPRLELQTAGALNLSGLATLSLGPAGSPQQTLRLLGDYPLDAGWAGINGGLRLTGGLLINLRGQAWQATGTDTPPTLPYAGIGYASTGTRRDWGFSADLGLAAGGLGLSLGNRGNTLGLGMDGGLRDLRLQPMLRLGMNLSF